MKLAMAELKSRGAVGLRAALIFYELHGEFGSRPMLTEFGVPCSVRGLAEHLGYRARAFANSFALLQAQRLIAQNEAGAYICANSDFSEVPETVQKVSNLSKSVLEMSKSIQKMSTDKLDNFEGETPDTLFALPQIPEQRKQRNRIYSRSPQAIYKRRQRAKLSLGARQNEMSNLSKTAESVQKMSKNVSLANIAINNNLAAQHEPQPVRLTIAIQKHLAKLGIEIEALYRKHKPLPRQTQTQLDALGIPAPYYSALTERYFTDGIAQILADLHRKSSQPKYQKFTQTPNHSTCTFLRWIIRGIEGDKYNRKTVMLRLSGLDAQRELLPLPHIQPDAADDSASSESEIDAIFQTLPWNRQKSTPTEIGA